MSEPSFFPEVVWTIQMFTDTPLVKSMNFRPEYAKLSTMKTATSVLFLLLACLLQGCGSSDKQDNANSDGTDDTVTGDDAADSATAHAASSTDSYPEAVVTSVDCESNAVFCAASCAQPDVQAAADAALAAELTDITVFIPQCDPRPYEWDGRATLSLTAGTGKNIRVIGAGVNATRISGFQIGVPGSGELNLVELGHMHMDGNDEVASIVDHRLRPESLNTELYWHDLVIQNYAANYTLALEGWHGLIRNMEMWCEDNPDGQNPYGIGVHGDGVYSDHVPDFGTRNALFIEDSRFDNCSHSVSCFCDAYVVFRHNTVSRADSHTDLHGPGYNYCYYHPDEETAGGGYELYNNSFVESQGNWVINARAGQGHIITGNTFDSADYQIVVYWDSGAVTHGNSCGTGPGETCERCDTFNCTGCCQAQEKTYIWDNDGEVMEYSGAADDCLIEDETYFLRPPSQAVDGFSWQPFPYPHPMAPE